MSASTAAVSLRGITKVFGAVRANNDISLDIHAGRIKALLGENGAGKSTLMSILSGHYLPDSGEIFIDGRPHSLRTTKDAIRAGIGMVYQHFMLVEAMTVAENVFLGQEPGFFLSPAPCRNRCGSWRRVLAWTSTPPPAWRTCPWAKSSGSKS